MRVILEDRKGFRKELPWNEAREVNLTRAYQMRQPVKFDINQPFDPAAVAFTTLTFLLDRREIIDGAEFMILKEQA